VAQSPTGWLKPPDRVALTHRTSGSEGPKYPGFGFNAVYFIIACFYVLGVSVITFMPRTGTITTSHASPWQEIAGGFRFIGRNRDILFLLGFFLLTVPLAWPFRQLIAIFADSVFEVGGKGMGILMSLSGAGAIAGSLVLASLPGKRRGLMMLCGTLALGLLLTAFSFSGAWGFSMGLMVFVGLAQTAQMTLSNTLVQHNTPDEYRGRVMGVYDMQMSFVGPATLVAGILTQRVGVQTAFGTFSIILTAVALLALLFVPRLRRLD
jgi:MFS family permease